MTSPAYVLVAHGSRDPRPDQIVAHLANLMGQELGNCPVGTAALDCQPEPLHQQLLNFYQQVQRPLRILPLFLLPGVHVKEDIPSEVAIARSQLPQTASLEILPYLGSHGRLCQVLQGQIQAAPPCQAWVLMAHGSRRPGGNAPIEALAAQLPQRVGVPVQAAYWSVDPRLEQQLQKYEQAGYDRVGVLPYFLCPGGLTDAIAEKLEAIARPQVILTDTLSQRGDLIHILLELCQGTPVSSGV
ncbi:MAG: sirohydrochlorin chelatase [Phormidium sp. GEM2.Bin31]|nr:MAG: sirohydrochlorin chelatase [Phormidium sp. GEM2.Bin31]